VRLKDLDESGVPVQVVGSIREPGDMDVFVIGEEENAYVLSEDEGLKHVFNVEAPLPQASPWLFEDLRAAPVDSADGAGAASSPGSRLHRCGHSEAAGARSPSLLAARSGTRSLSSAAALE